MVNSAGWNRDGRGLESVSCRVMPEPELNSLNLFFFTCMLMWGSDETACVPVPAQARHMEGSVPKTRLSCSRKELYTSSFLCLIPWVLKWNLACLNTWLYTKKTNLWTRRKQTKGFFSSLFTNSEYFSFTMAVKDDSGFPGNSDERNINPQFE